MARLMTSASKTIRLRALRNWCSSSFRRTSRTRLLFSSRSSTNCAMAIAIRPSISLSFDSMVRTIPHPKASRARFSLAVFLLILFTVLAGCAEADKPLAEAKRLIEAKETHRRDYVTAYRILANQTSEPERELLKRHIEEALGTKMLREIEAQTKPRFQKPVLLTVGHKGGWYELKMDPKRGVWHETHAWETPVLTPTCPDGATDAACPKEVEKNVFGKCEWALGQWSCKLTIKNGFPPGLTKLAFVLKDGTTGNVQIDKAPPPEKLCPDCEKCEDCPDTGTASGQIVAFYGSDKTNTDFIKSIGDISAFAESEKAATERCRVQVVGHTDTSGQTADNFRLGRTRAISLAEAVENRGGPKANDLYSCGENLPVIPEGAKIESANRRAVATLSCSDDAPVIDSSINANCCRVDPHFDECVKGRSHLASD